MPQVWGVKLTGELPDWVSAKDVILELLMRHGVEGGVNKIIEYYGPGLKNLSAMDRHVIANMGTELGLTTSVFPSDEKVEEFLVSQKRSQDWSEWLADPGCEYDLHEEIDLSKLEPLIACPSSPGNVVPVTEVAGKDVQQCVVGSSANPGFRDFAIVAKIMEGRQAKVSLDVNPTSRQIFENMANQGLIKELYHSGARLHQAGCNGCIGMGQAPASGMISLRTMPRNFPGRSGTVDDQVYLCSPETAAASALTGKITDPRTLDFPYPKVDKPAELIVNTSMLQEPSKNGETKLVKGPNIKPMPDFDPMPDSLSGPVLLSLGDDVSTDEIMPAGQKVLPYRSNIPAIAEFVFSAVDKDFPRKCKEAEVAFVAAGRNYGQGSSREHAALAPRYLGLRAVMAVSLARIHRQNLINYGILPLIFENPEDLKKVEAGNRVELGGLKEAIASNDRLVAKVDGEEIGFRLELSERDRTMLAAGGRIPWFKKERTLVGSGLTSS
jgi:aconitate hydratase